MTSVSRCIFCLEEKPLTDEHIVLKTLGGDLSKKLLCKECNSRFGEGLDAEFGRQLPNKLAKFAMGTTGRAKRVQGPFEGVRGKIVGEDIDIIGTKGFDFKVAAEPQVSIEENGELRVRGAFSPNVSKEYVGRSVDDAVRKALDVRFPGMEEEKKIRLMNDWLKNFSEEDFNKRSIDTVMFRETINLSVWELSFEKIAYELACMLFGDEYYLKSHSARKLRDDINEGNYAGEHYCRLFPEFPIFSKILAYLNKHEKNAVIVMDGFAHIQISGIEGTVRFEKDDAQIIRDILDAQIFIFERNEHAEPRFVESNFCQWFTSERHRSEEIALLYDSLQRLECD